MLPERSRVQLLFQECWIRLNREGRTQDCQNIRETGRAYVSLFAEKYIGSPFVQKDLVAAASMVDVIAAIALYAWRQQHTSAGDEEVYQHFLCTPFSQLVENGVALYQQVVGDPSEMGWTSSGSTAIALFSRDYPLFLRVREDVKTLERVAEAFKFGKVGAYGSARDAIIDLREDGQVLARVLRSVLAGMAMGFRKPWLTLYPDGMLMVLRTLYLDRARGLDAPWTRSVCPEAALDVCLSGQQSAVLTVQDREMITSSLQDAVTELQRMWDDPKYLSDILACPGPETFYVGKQVFFRTAFFDTGPQMFDGDYCAGTSEWDLAAFSLPVWVIFLEKASGIPFDGDGDDEDALLEYLRDQRARIQEHPPQWELAASFLLTDAPWVPSMREHLTLVLDTLKCAMSVIQGHGCDDDHVRTTLAVLNGLEYGPQAQD
jgi:hypothetical protein